MKTCSISGCLQQHYAKGFCHAHYDAQPDRRAAAAKSFAKWEKTDSGKRRVKANQNARLRRPSGRFSWSKYRAKSRGLLWDLTLEQYAVLISQPCHYGDGNHPLNPTGVGLDRLDNQRGYEIGNVVPCCGLHNFQKGSLEHAGFRYPRIMDLMQELGTTQSRA